MTDKAAERRVDPAKMLVALGAILAMAGVLPWLLFSLGLRSLYEPIFRSVGFRSSFHPLAQVEGFLACFAIAFLFAYIPQWIDNLMKVVAPHYVGRFTQIGLILARAHDRWTTPGSSAPARTKKRSRKDRERDVEVAGGAKLVRTVLAVALSHGSTI